MSAVPQSTTTALNHFNIPAPLRKLNQWVLWRLEARNGKATKTPYQPNGAMAKVNDSTTWRSYPTVLAAYQAGGFNGIGLVLTEADDIVGVDLDQCLNPETGELDAEAARIVSELPTYCEVSPSGRGLRLFGKGSLPQGGRRKGKVELYESGRYLTVTGHRFNGHEALANITTEIAAVHARIFAAAPSAAASPVGIQTASDPLDLDDTALLAKIRTSKQGMAFDRLWSGPGQDHSADDLALCNVLAFWSNGDAARMDRLFRQSGLMRDKWDEPHYADGRTHGQGTMDKAIANLREGYSGRSSKKASQPSEAPAQPASEPLELALDPYRGTDEANAVLFLELHGQDVRYCPPWSTWLLWTATHWRIDDRLDIDRLAGDLPKMLYRRAAEFNDSKQRRSIVDLGRSLESTHRRTAFLLAARCRLVVHHSDLNKGHFLLNASNGTVNLKTGELREHRRMDLLTHDTEIPYQPDAACPTWQRFLSDVFQGDAELISFVQRAIGYSLTGSVTEQVLLICYGSGSNGKSVFLNILRRLLGSLALQAAPDLLMADRYRRHPTEQADLFGKRLVVCQETAEGRRFNESLVKQLTGGDAIRARRMHENFWEFPPTHKLWLATNHRPEIKGTDHAIWRRPRLIPFDVQFTDEGLHRKDPDMEAKLMAELPGILAWSVRGCLAWQRDGLGIPQAVRAATEAYRADMDVLAAWISECCVTGKRCEAKAADLYGSYTRWCESNGETPEAQRKWGMRLTERGFQRDRRMAGHFWVGIGLLDTHHDPYDPYDPEMTSFEPNVQTSPKNDDSGSYGSYGSYTPPKPPEKPPSLSVEAMESGLEPGLSSVTRDIEVFD